MEWFAAVAALKPHVVQITTPQGSGTGFLLWRAKTTGFAAVATAAHVIDHANYWEQPIRLRGAETGEVQLLRPGDRAIFVDSDKDTAVILFEPAGLSFPSTALELIEEGKALKVGVSVGWLGYPAMAPMDLCFFSGSISAWRADQSAYFVDGVAINGVSGGPAFNPVTDPPYVVGVVSAYMPNRATGELLPGLAIVRDVVQFQDLVKRFPSLEQAKAEEPAPQEPPPSPPSASGAGPTGPTGPSTPMRAT